ncbi:hypothetical protein PFISCL1PPCAC_10765, partial [Pristionchus fissidentatus]
TYLNSSDIDLVEYHIRRYLNHQFTPCSDFFQFTCNSDNIEKNSLATISEDFYKKILDSTPTFNGTQIDIDIDNLIQDNNNSSVFSPIEYSIALTERCGTNNSCFEDEFRVSYKVYTFLRLNSTLLLQAGFNESLAALLLYEGVRARLRVTRRLEENREKLGEITIKTREMAILTAELLMNKFNKTKWMHELSPFNLSTFVQFSEILQNLTLRTDFDHEFDFNDLGSLEHTIKFSLLYATSQLSLQLRQEGRAELLFRLSHPYEFSSGNVVDGIVLCAPSFFPLSMNIRHESLLGSLGTRIARELIFRFVHPRYRKRYMTYSEQFDGIAEHFEASCRIFGREDCNLIRSHLQYYVADLEGLNLSYKLLRLSMDYESLQTQPYSELPFTSEQLFFIAHSISFCRDAQFLSQEVS